MSTREVIFKMLEEKTKDELKLYQEKKLDGISEIKKEKNELIRKLKRPCKLQRLVSKRFWVEHTSFMFMSC